MRMDRSFQEPGSRRLCLPATSATDNVTTGMCTRVEGRAAVMMMTRCSAFRRAQILRREDDDVCLCCLQGTREKTS